MKIYAVRKACSILPLMSINVLVHCSVEDCLKCLNEYGVCVITDVIPPDQCDTHRHALQQWLQTFPANQKPLHISSLIQSYGIAHHPAVWATRLATKPVFEQIWQTSKLHSSTDGIAIGEPPELGSNRFAEQVAGGAGLHVDQCRYQGAVYLEEATADDWCFQVLLHSHKHHQQLFASADPADDSDVEVGGDEYQALSSDQQEWYKQRGCHEQRIAVPKGAMVLWDSRTIHAGAPARMRRAHTDRWRYVVFVSMTPAIWSSANDVARKVKAYHDAQVSFHWSSRGFGLFASQDVTSQSITELPDIARSDDARLLVGGLAYDFNDGASNGPDWTPVIVE